MLSKLRYITQKGAMQGKHLIEKAAGDFNNLTKVCFFCDSVHSRKPAGDIEFETEQVKHEDKHFTSSFENYCNLVAESLHDKSNVQGNNVDQKHYSLTESDRLRPEQSPVLFTKNQENQKFTQKRYLSTTSRLFPKRGTRRTHTDTSMGWLAGRLEIVAMINLVDSFSY